MMVMDAALERREQEGRPIRVGLVGAGYMGSAIALQLAGGRAGLRLGAIASRTLAHAERAYRDAGVAAVTRPLSSADFERALAAGTPVVTDDAALLAAASGIEVLIEATGDVEFGARVALDAIAHGKHVILVNAELDGTVGPILRVEAERRGVVLTGTDGDEPGVAMNLVRLVRTLGLRPVGAGNLKGFLDHYRTPASQREFAARHGLNPCLATAAADGTKLAIEATNLANATGFHVGRRGMYGPRCAHVRDAACQYPLEQLLDGGLVDYLLGAEPHTGAFVLAYEDHPVKRQHLGYLKMGDGPVYVFSTPYHLPHLQVIPTVARAVLFHDATVAPRGEPVCDVLTVAKRDSKIGDVLDGIGGFACYGVIDNADVVARERLLPIGVAHGCRLTRAVRRDEPITYDDVELPEGRLVDRLRSVQAAHFGRESRPR
jgi:predicted homoserine dehydrogenase-like protein